MSNTEAADVVVRSQSSSSDSTLWLRNHFRILAIGLGGLHAWTAAVQQSMNEDGISYLDMGDAYLRGDWSMAVNTVWSPLYAWILGLAMKLVRPTMQWEFSLVHVVNFAIYLFALIAFEFFWRQVMASSRTGSSLQLKNKEATFPDWAWVSIGYALFIWSSLSLIKVWSVTPDMLVAGIVYIVGGLLLRISRGPASWSTFCALGLILGIAYLAKAVMFPIALIFLATCLFLVGDLRSGLPRIATALIAFLLIAAPFVSLLSLSKGRLTFGDAGRLTYLKYTNAIPYPHWKSDIVSGVETPYHPARQIFDNPAVFEFAAPVGGTYPLSYDPSYWYEGVVARLDIQRQITILITSAQFYFDLFLRQQGSITATVLLLLLLRSNGLRRRERLSGEWGLLIVALAGFALYALVYVETRYIGAFLVLFWAGVFSLIRLPDSQLSRRLLRAGGVLLLAFICINIATFNLEGVRKLFGGEFRPSQNASQADAPKYRPLQFAEAVLEMGLRPGDEIAFIGYSFGAFFARLARLRIIADISDVDAEQFWRADSATRSAVLDTIGKTGVKAIIAESVLPGASVDGWERIGKSRHFLYRLR